MTKKSLLLSLAFFCFGSQALPVTLEEVTSQVVQYCDPNSLVFEQIDQCGPCARYVILEFEGAPARQIIAARKQCDAKDLEMINFNFNIIVTKAIQRQKAARFCVCIECSQRISKRSFPQLARN